MANPIQRGDGSPQLQRITGSYSPTSGYTYDQEYMGLSPAQMQALANFYSSNGCEFELTIQHGIATLRTRDTRGNVTIDIWEIGISRSLISTFKNPRNIAAIPATELALLAFAADKGLSDLSGAATAFNSDAYLTARYPGVTDAIGDAGKRLWERVFLFKEDSTYYDIYTIRHTSNVSNRWPYNVADSNKNCIYTPSQFYAEVQNANDWLFPMPQAYVNVLESNPIPDGPGALFMNYGYFTWGFLKSGSPRSTAANNRSNIVTEYTQFLWSNDEYESV